ncbi:MAG: alpha/beta hydrolase [Gammaproteobacteria bacterium]
MTVSNHPHTSTADVKRTVRQSVLNATLRHIVKRRLRSVPVILEAIIKLRAEINTLAGRFLRTNEDAAIVQDVLADVPVERIRPLEASGRVVLYIHGGAFMFCSPVTHRGITLPLASRTRCEVIAVAYRLAPEHPYPAAVNDSLAVYLNLLETIPAHDITLAGDSAGGNLVLALLHTLKDKGLPMPSSAVCLSPVTDLSGGSDSIRQNIESDVLLPGERMHELARLYINGAYVREPAVSPVFGDFTGFPPLLFHVGDSEILLDDSRRAVARARSCGVEAHLRIWPNLPHVFHAFSSHLPVAFDALEEIAEFMVVQFQRPL